MDKRYITLNSITVSQGRHVTNFRFDKEARILEYNVPGLKDNWTPWADEQLTLKQAKQKVADASWSLSQE